MNAIAARGKQSIEIVEGAVVEVEDGAHITLMIRPQRDMELVLRIGRGCEVSTFTVQENGSSVKQVNHVGPDSVVRSYGFWFFTGDMNILNSLEGDKSKAYDVHVFAQKDSGKFHLDTILRHEGKDTKGSILVKGIVMDNASAKLDGMIKIGKGGSGAESFLSEHVILLSPDAHASANPELEIENNDVSSRHAASVSQIDEDKLFYLVSRGISREEAKKLMVEGFLASAVEKIEDGEIRGQMMARTMEAV